MIIVLLNYLAIKTKALTTSVIIATTPSQTIKTMTATVSVTMLAVKNSLTIIPEQRLKKTERKPLAVKQAPMIWLFTVLFVKHSLAEQKTLFLQQVNTLIEQETKTTIVMFAEKPM